MNFCNHCAAPVELRVPEGDQRPRFVCTSCGRIHYENPRIVTGCVPEYEGRILLCKRAIEPRVGYWTVPAGFLENGESLEQGAARECWEEALAKVEVRSLLALVSVTQAQQVHVFFRAQLATPDFGVGVESLETELVAIEDIPWTDLAFRSTRYALDCYVEDLSAGRDTCHVTEFTQRR
jgi:ADP-ribose pyrophosphatase YjhB (NUDIX family)